MIRRRRQVPGPQQPAPTPPLDPIVPVEPASTVPDGLAPVQQAPIVPVAPAPQPTAQDVVKYEQNIKREENQLGALLRSMMTNKYMPTRDQVIQLMTTVLTLVLMLALGPVMGSNAGLIQSIVKQVVPFIVSYTVHYAADQALPPQQIEAPITQVQLEPVSVPRSTVGQTI